MWWNLWKQAANPDKHKRSPVPRCQNSKQENKSSCFRLEYNGCVFKYRHFLLRCFSLQDQVKRWQMCERWRKETNTLLSAVTAGTQLSTRVSLVCFVNLYVCTGNRNGRYLLQKVSDIVTVCVIFYSFICRKGLKWSVWSATPFYHRSQ